MNKAITTIISILTFLSLLHNSHCSTKEYNIILQTGEYFYSATFMSSPNHTHPILSSITQLPYSISNTHITAVTACSVFLYYSTDSHIERLMINTPHRVRIKLPDSFDISSMAIDPYCRSIFTATSSSLQISASNVSSSLYTPRFLTSRGVLNNSINSFSYDYNNYQLLYTTSQNEVQQLKFNTTSPKVLLRHNTQVINSAVSDTHLYTLERNSTHTGLWQSPLDKLNETPIQQRVWKNTEELNEFIVTADGQWMFYLLPQTGEVAVTSITSSSTTDSVVFHNLTDIRSLLLIPDTTQHQYTDPCLASSCTHLCLPLSHSQSSCHCPNGERQLSQTPQCNTDLYGSTLLSTDTGVYVLRSDDGYVASSLLPLIGYPPYSIKQLTASDHWIYWSEDYVTDIPYSLIVASDTIMGHSYVIVSELLGHVSGLAVDKLSDSLFWSDELLRRIEVSRTNGLYRRVLYDSDVIIGTPSYLVVDLEHSDLYWVEFREGVYRILSAPMDASSNPMVLVEEGIGIPTSLALDPVEAVLYWSDSNGVQGFDLERRTLLSNYFIESDSISSISVKDGKILNLKTNSLTSVFRGDSLLFQSTRRIHTISTVHDYSDRTSPCGYGSAQLECPHICLPSYTGQYTCMCGVGFELSSNNGVTSCDEIRETLYLSQPGVLEVYQNSPLLNFRQKPSLDIRLRSEVNSTVSAVSSDVREGYVYWSNMYEGVVGRARKDGNEKQVILEGYHSVRGLSFDALSGNLYWSDDSTGLLGVSTPDGGMQKVLLHSRNSIPYTLATNPRSGGVYYSTRGSPHTIMLFYGNSGTVETLVSVRGSAVALSIDADTNEVYWARNASLENLWQPTVLKCSPPDCTDTSFLLDFSTDIKQIDISGGRLFSIGSFPSNPDFHFVQKHFLPSGQIESVITTPEAKPGALHLSHISNQPSQHICAVNNGGCSHFCLLTQPGLSYVCECPPHMKLSGDERNCEPRDTFVLLLTDFYVLALNKYPYIMDEAIPVGTLHNSRFLSFDPLANTVYWLDQESANNSVLKSFGLNRGEMKPTEIASISTRESQLFNFQIDWVARLALWTRTDGHSIEFSRLDNTLAGYLFNDSTSTFHPRALATDPTTSRIFFSDWSSSPSIYSTELDGSRLEVVVSSDVVSRPSSIVYCHRYNSLFWYDLDKQEIAVYNFTTQQVSTIHTFSKVNAITSGGYTDMKIAISGDELVWWETQSVPTRFHYYNLHTGSTSATDVSEVGSVHDMLGHTVEPNIHHDAYQCLSIGCQGICVERMESIQCTCPLYTSFDTASTSCQPITCPYTPVVCEPGEECSDVTWRCDGIQNCIDGSDELNCTSTTTATTTTIITTNIVSNSTYPSVITDGPAKIDIYSLHLIILTLTLIIICLICVVLLTTVVTFYLVRRGKTYKLPSRNQDVETSMSTPSTDQELASLPSTCPIMKPATLPKHIYHFQTLSTSSVGRCSLNPYSLINRQTYIPITRPELSINRSIPSEIQTADLVSDVTNASLERFSFNYSNVSELSPPPPSEATDYSVVHLSVSQQDIPSIVGDQYVDRNSHHSSLNHSLHYNSEISTDLSTDFSSRTCTTNPQSFQKSSEYFPS